MNEIVFRFFKVLLFFELVTLAYSLFCCITTDKIFAKNFKNKNLSYIPIYNILVLLDIVKLNRIMSVLLFVPVTNVIIFILIEYRLSIMFNLSKGFTIGLIIFPVIMLPILNYIKMKTLEVEHEYDDVRDEMVTLLTENEINDLNQSEEEEVKVDNAFKREEIKPANEVPVFKASQNNYEKLFPAYDKNLNDYKEESEIKPEKVERVQIVNELPTPENKPAQNKFVNIPVDNEEKKDEDSDIELLNF